MSTIAPFNAKRERELGLAIAMLVEAFGVKNITPVRIKVYEKALSKIPSALLGPTIERAIETRTPKCADWLPSIEELREDAEAVRREWLDRNRYEGCAQCEDSIGWQAVLVEGVPRVQRCGCWTRHMEKLAAMGIGPDRIALPVPDRVALPSGDGD